MRSKYRDYTVISTFDTALCKLRIFHDDTWTWLNSGESNTSSIARQFRACVQLKNKKQD